MVRGNGDMLLRFPPCRARSMAEMGNRSQGNDEVKRAITEGRGVLDTYARERERQDRVFLGEKGDS